jgi:hypothetical protein
MHGKTRDTMLGAGRSREKRNKKQTEEHGVAYGIVEVVHRTHQKI